jgi:hypothetical protein
MATLNHILDTGQQRRDSLWQLVDAINKPIATSSAPRAKTLRGLLVCLQRFGEKQLGFFLNGFTQDGALVEHPLYSAEYALDVTHNQIGYDLDVILRAYHHRTHRISPVGQAVTSMRQRLHDADLAAQQSLQPALDVGLLMQQSTAVTYYQKSPSIRVIPYAPVALIGIPFSAASEPRDYASIAHEVGHYVFWRRPKYSDGQIRDFNYLDRSRRILGAEPPTNELLGVIDPWLEEIFADLYGCLVAGPLAGFTMVEMARRLPGTRWFEDDGAHPPPALRSIVYQACLRLMAESATGDALERITDAMERMKTEQARWLGDIPDWLTVRLHNGQTANYIRLAEMLEEVVEKVLDPQSGMLGALLPQGDRPWPLWDTPPFDKMPAFSFSQPGETPPEPLDLRVIEKKGEFTVQLAESEWQAGSTGLPDEDWERARDGDSDARVSLKAAGLEPWWLAVLSAGFWTTEGPGAGNPHPPG